MPGRGARVQPQPVPPRLGRDRPRMARRWAGTIPPVVQRHMCRRARSVGANDNRSFAPPTWVAFIIALLLASVAFGGAFVLIVASLPL